MKLLIITQKVDKNDPVLGFMHRWIEEFSKSFDKVTVICLWRGEYNLPGVAVHSLGKESSKGVLVKLWRFYRYIWQLRRDYDAVFVHMNQEYVILGWKIWWILNKPIYMWRNHGHGDIFTRLAGFFSHKVFYTSPNSFTASFKNSVKMPVGIDTNFFKPVPNAKRIPNSVLFLGRISPVKKVLEFIDWIKGTDYIATIAGPILSEDREYGEIVKSRALDNKRIKFIGPVNKDEALKLYQTHQFYANKTPAGSFDKTIFEALACGCALIVDNPDAKNIKIEEHSLEKLMQKLKKEMV